MTLPDTLTMLLVRLVTLALLAVERLMDLEVPEKPQRI
jgi:hypothetical protein